MVLTILETERFEKNITYFLAHKHIVMNLIVLLPPVI